MLKNIKVFVVISIITLGIPTAVGAFVEFICTKI